MEKCVNLNLKNLILKKLVFNILLEKGTQLNPYLEKDTSIAIWIRMLYQLKSDEQEHSFKYFHDK